MRELQKIGLLLACYLILQNSQAQTILAKPLKVAVFAPIYLDSIFADDGYKLGRNYLPKYVLPGLDFYNGMMLAVDSLNVEKASLTVLFFDSKSVEMPIDSILTLPECQDVSLIIASFTNRIEIKPLADFAFQKKIPLLSATYPNDGGITGNPYFVLMNPTLTTHLEAIYKYLHRLYPTNKICLITKQGNLERIIQNTFNSLNKKTAGIPLKIQTIELSDSFTTTEVINYLDSTQQNIILCGTLNEQFGANLTKAISSAKNYRVMAVGMPTWDGIKDINKNIEIVYTTPYNFSRMDKTSLQFINQYKQKYAGRPSDMAFKGFEALFHFGKLLLKYNQQIIQQLSSKEFKLFNDFSIQPVTVPKTSPITHYLENKKLYFIRKSAGRILSVN